MKKREFTSFFSSLPFMAYAFVVCLFFFLPLIQTIGVLPLVSALSIAASCAAFAALAPLVAVLALAVTVIFCVSCFTFLSCLIQGDNSMNKCDSKKFTCEKNTLLATKCSENDNNVRMQPREHQRYKPSKTYLFFNEISDKNIIGNCSSTHQRSLRA